jgi:hypothetical protein
MQKIEVCFELRRHRNNISKYIPTDICWRNLATLAQMFIFEFEHLGPSTRQFVTSISLDIQTVHDWKKII